MFIMKSQLKEKGENMFIEAYPGPLFYMDRRGFFNCLHAASQSAVSDNFHTVTRLHNCRKALRYPQV